MPAAYDQDLRSIQEARRRAVAAREAQREFAFASQEEVDRICAAMADAAFAQALRLGHEAVAETGYGIPVHKRLKNEFASRDVWRSIADVKTVGEINRDDERKVVDIAWPVGVIAALTPSTNPTSTVMFKVLIAVKARNGIVVAPHPSAAACSAETARIMAAAGEAAGMPAGLVSCMEEVTLPGSTELLHHYATSLILATGGPGMVKAAHSAGKPAIGVGPGNVPVYVDRSADVAKAASDIVNSKAFDCSTICSTEQSVVADRPVADQLRREMESHGAYWLDADQRAAIGRSLFDPNGGIVARSVGKTPQQLAAMAGISVPAAARVLVAELEGVGHDHPLSHEKLTTVLGWYVEEGWRAGCERSIQLLKFGGDGHSLVIHASDPEVIMAFGLEKPAFRIIVNTWGTLGAIGATTGVMPSMTLAPGGIGGAVVSDNITVHNVLNVKRLAYELRPPPELAYQAAPGVTGVPVAGSRDRFDGADPAAIAEVVRRVLAEMRS
jgi:acetaldehyde dehydrogenase (acetylating)